MKTTMLACLLFAAALFLKPNICLAAELTEIPGWQCGELAMHEFDTVSGNRGFCQQRDYVTGSGTRLHAIWLEGAGEKGWVPPAESVSADDGLMGSGSVYRTIEIAGEKAIIEHHPVTGYCAAVKINGKGTLTVESKYAEENNFVAAAAELVESLKQ